MFSRLSIFQKLLIAPLPALLLFAVFTLYLYNQQKASKKFLSSIENSHFPTIKVGDENVLLFKNIVKSFKNTVLTSEERLLDDAMESKEKIDTNLEKLLYMDIDKKNILKIKECLNHYFTNELKFTLFLIKGGNSLDTKKIIIEINKELQQTQNQLENFQKEQHQRFIATTNKSNVYNKKILFLGVGLGLIALIIIIFLTLILSFSTKKYINQLYISIKNIADGKPDFSKRIEEIGDDEFGMLIREFNKFTNKLEMDYKELAISKEKAESATKIKSEFIANMSHEIRTPLNAVIGFSELLERTEVTEKQKSYLKSIKLGGKTLLGIINDILDLSKIEAGKLELKNEAISIITLIQEMKMVFEPKAKNKNLNLFLTIDKNIPEYLLLDETRMRQVLFNLVGNAIKFTHQGSIEIKVSSIKLNSKEISLQIDVIDTGIGIPQDEQEHIFESFVQKEGQSNRHYGGTGLGLAICLKLMKMMEGNLTLKSRPYVGSTFSMVLYRVKTIGVDIEPNIEIINDKIEFEPATILIVDDIELNRRLILNALDKSNLTLIEASNGQEALLKSMDNKIDLILMDIKMPVLNGIEVTKRLRKNHIYKYKPIIALTATTISYSEKREEEELFNSYLMKPISPKKIIDEVASFLPHKRIIMTPTYTSLDSNNLNLENIDKKLFIERFEKELLKSWTKASKGWSFEDTLVFAKELDNFAIAYGYMELKDFSNKLEKYIENFDIQKMEESMKKFASTLRSFGDS